MTAGRSDGEPPPPVFGSWRAFHVAVVVVLVAIIAALDLLTRSFR